MARWLAYLYGAACSLGVINVSVPGYPGFHVQGILALAGTAGLCAALLLRFRGRVPLWTLHALVALGTAFVGAAISLTEGVPNAASFLYLWIVLYAFYFFSRPAAVVHLLLVAASYAVVIALQPPPYPPVGHWLTIVATLAVAGLLVGALRDRIRAVGEEAELLVEHAPDGIVQVETGGRIVRVNRQLEQLFGYEPEELVGQAIEVLIPERLRAGHGGHRESYEARPGTRPMGRGLDLHGRRKDGTEFPVEISLSPLQGTQRAATMAIVRDITERRTAERELRRAARYFDVASELLCTLSPDSRLLRLNGGWEPAVGWAPEQIASVRLTEFLHVDDRRQTATLLARAAAQRETVAFSTRFRTQAEDWRWLDWVATGDADGLIYASARDVTDRKRIEAELRLHGEIVSTMAEGVVLVNASDRTIVYANPRYEEMLGYEPGELVGQPIEVVISPDAGDPGETATSIVTALERHGEWSGEVLNRRADGSDLWCSARVSAFNHPERGKLWVSVQADITERKRVEAEREQALGEAMRSNADLEQFGFSVSHDLSEPLRVISGFAELLEEGHSARLDDEAAGFLRAIKTSAGRMQALIDGLLVYSRVGHGTLERAPVDTGRVVEQVLAGLDTLLKERHAKIEVAALPQVVGEPRLLGQVFQNLISNAVKFANGHDPEVEVSARREPGAWRFVVSDNGPGVDPRQGDRIFEVFHRLHGREVEGTGIGLAICKRIVERHGGDIGVDARASGGSVFSFTLPDGDLSE